MQLWSVHADITCRIIVMTVQRAFKSISICIIRHTSFKILSALTLYLVKNFIDLGVRSFFLSSPSTKTDALIDLCVPRN